MERRLVTDVLRLVTVAHEDDRSADRGRAGGVVNALRAVLSGLAAAAVLALLLYSLVFLPVLLSTTQR